MHDAVKLALREAVGKVLADYRRRNVSLVPEPHLVWRRTRGGWHGEEQLRPSISTEMDGAETKWEVQASGIAEALLAHHQWTSWHFGTATTGWRNCAPSELLRIITLRVVADTGSVAFNPTAVNQIIDEVSDYLDHPFVMVPFLAPVLNFSTDRTEPVVLDGGITLRAVTDDEMTKLHGGPVRLRGSSWRHPFVDFVFAGELRERREPVVTPSDAIQSFRELKAKLDHLVLGLRTFKHGPVGYTEVHFLSKSLVPLLGAVITRGFGDAYVPMGRYTISGAEVEPLNLHMRLVAADLAPSLAAACGRLAAAQGRTEPRDKLIDAVVGLEAILLADRGDPQYRGEMRFRFATHYAVLHETSAERYE